MSIKTPNTIDVSVGARMRLRRTMLGMSQESLASKIGITFQQIQKYEKGTNRIGASRLRLIADLLAVPIGYFFAEGAFGSQPVGDVMQDVNNVASFLTSREGIELNRAFMKIRSPEARRCIIKLAKVLAAPEAPVRDDGPILHTSTMIGLSSLTQ